MQQVASAASDAHAQTFPQPCAKARRKICGAGGAAFAPTNEEGYVIGTYRNAR
jgi:hypothetical protein